LCRDGYNVLTFDAADGAKGPDADFFHATTSGYLEDLEDVVEYVLQQDWYRAPLLIVAHSLGGMIALRYTRNHQSQVSKLILLAPAVSWKAGFHIVVFIAGVLWLITNKHTTPGPDHSKLPQDRAWLLDFMKFDMKRDAPYVSIPTLIISASKDQSVADPRAHFSLAQRFPNATSIVIPDAKHVFWKHEQQVGDTITKWLTSS
jgi:alpha-beta hydrolase superfamily lysophospholipase